MPILGSRGESGGVGEWRSRTFVTRFMGRFEVARFVALRKTPQPGFSAHSQQEKSSSQDAKRKILKGDYSALSKTLQRHQLYKVYC